MKVLLPIELAPTKLSCPVRSFAGVKYFEVVVLASTKQLAPTLVLA